ncbi:unnamed protein product [Fraxinus pennsylvanica]|uniref:RING-type domain-containing protein n=1 Tax=Fraxinus pennsylvanica TaxID=56036 RepID=A0AAD1Z6B5_9LAMI|nr:unnamed protein product [Fraxinus pennsylvanica]
MNQVAKTRQSHAQEILNIIAPFKSFTAMLTEADSSILTPNVQDQSAQVDQMIQTHNENLRWGLARMWGKHYNMLQCAAEEIVAKKLKDQEMELIKMAHQNEQLEEMLSNCRAEAQRLFGRNKKLEELVSRFRADGQNLSGRLKSTERLVTSLRGELRTAMSEGPNPGTQEEDAESSYVDPERDFSVNLECKVCESRLATVMLWPCCHVCICPRCEANRTEATRSCPVCRTDASTSVRVHLPLN